MFAIVLFGSFMLLFFGLAIRAWRRPTTTILAANAAHAIWDDVHDRGHRAAPAAFAGQGLCLFGALLAFGFHVDEALWPSVAVFVGTFVLAFRIQDHNQPRWMTPPHSRVAGSGREFKAEQRRLQEEFDAKRTRRQEKDEERERKRLERQQRSD